jgi:flagellar motility protein MotE (MotC chaperone)
MLMHGQPTTLIRISMKSLSILVLCLLGSLARSENVVQKLFQMKNKKQQQQGQQCHPSSVVEDLTKKLQYAQEERDKAIQSKDEMAVELEKHVDNLFALRSATKEQELAEQQEQDELKEANRQVAKMKWLVERLEKDYKTIEQEKVRVEANYKAISATYNDVLV